MIWYIAGCAAALAAAGTLCLYAESKRFEINEYEFESEKLLRDEYRFVVMSDLHNREFGRDNEELLRAVDRIGPDCVMFAGDMVESRKGAPFDATVRFIVRLAKKYPIYYGVGNHEHRLRTDPEKYGPMYRDFTRAIGKGGVHIMENERLEIPGTGIVVYGFDLDRYYYRKLIPRKLPDDYLERKLGRAEAGRFSILLAHHPDPFPVYSKWGPELVLSGHIHGGIIRLPGLGGVVSPQMRLFPKYDGGEYREGNSVMVLSRGIGTHTIPVRIFNRAEILVITLRRKTKQVRENVRQDDGDPGQA